MLFPRFTHRIPAALLSAALAIPLWGAQFAVAGQDAYDADLEDTPPSRVGRISRLDGDAAMRQSGAADWSTVVRNAPVFEGDEFFTDTSGRLEMQLGGGRYVRLGDDTDVVVAALDEKNVRLEMPVGHVIISLRHFGSGESFEVSAPASAVTIRDEGVYRIDVDDDGNTQVAVHGGQAEVATPDRSVRVDDGETATMPYGDPSQVDLVAWTQNDAFDTWSTNLDLDYQRYDASGAGSSDVASMSYRNDIYGLSELSLYGRWSTYDGYGTCWYPSVSSGWSPYSNGYWQYYPRYGYTWISYDAWGWAPFHYGRWAWISPFGWAWIPWDTYGSSYSPYNYGWGSGYYPWSPGLVGWYQYPGVPQPVWVPLAPGEPYSGWSRLHRRHDRDFVPRHLREGRGIGVAVEGSGARITPGGSKPSFGGRTPVAIVPDAPRDVRPVAAQIKPTLSESIRNRPVVVKEVKPSGSDAGTGRSPVTARPIRPATGTTVVKPVVRRPKSAEEVPTMVGERPVPRDPKVVKPRSTVNPNDSGQPRVVTKPKRDPAEKPSYDRPKQPDRIERNTAPVERSPKVDRTPKEDRSPKVDRVERVAPRSETRVERSAPRAEPKVNRSAPRSETRVERSAPRAEPKVDRSAPTVNIAPAPKGVGGGRHKP